MKNRLVLYVCIVFSGFAFAQTPNSSMENWSSEPLLINWKTNSYPLTLPPYDPYIVRKDSDSYSGKWAANLYANGVFKAFAKTTFPVVQHPFNLTLYYKLIFAPCVNDLNFSEKDTASVLVELMKQGSVVDQGYWESTVSSTDYMRLEVPISQNSVVVDSCRITFRGGKIFGGCGIVAQATEFKVDQVELRYSDFPECIDPDAICITCVCPENYEPVCGCDENTYSNECVAKNAGLTSWSAGICDTPTGLKIDTSIPIEFNVYPNPATHSTTLRFSNPFKGSIELELYSLVGELLYSYPLIEIREQNFERLLDLPALNPGIYFFRAKTNSHTINMVKLIVVRI